MLRTFAFVSLAALSLSACTVGSSRRHRAPPPPPPAGQWQAPAGPQQAAGAQGNPLLRGVLGPQANAHGALLARGFRIPVAAYNRPVNAQGLRGLRGRTQCDPEEVAPGKWISFDCGGESRVRQAIAHVLNKKHGFLPGTLPAMVDHRQMQLTGPVKDQGAVGACTAFSLSTAMDNGVRKMGRTDVVAPLHVWSKYAVPMMGVAGDETVEEALTTEQVWPYDPAKACKLMKNPGDSCGVAYGVAPGSGNVDPQIQAERSQADSSGQFRLDAVEQLQSKPADPNEIAAVLAGGDAIWISFWVNRSAWKSKSLQGGVIPHYEGRDQTGHAVVLTGYRTVGSGKQFLIHNSWGPGWGDNGYAWMEERTLVKHIRNAYKIRVTDGKGQSPQPNSSGCPQGQVRDAVFGGCANPCPSGSAPAAGVCLPKVPGLPAPGPGPANTCPQGQAPDGMSGQCVNLCPNGVAPIGGMCLPTWGQ